MSATVRRWTWRTAPATPHRCAFSTGAEGTSADRCSPVPPAVVSASSARGGRARCRRRVTRPLDGRPSSWARSSVLTCVASSSREMWAGPGAGGPEPRGSRTPVCPSGPSTLQQPHHHVHACTHLSMKGVQDHHRSHGGARSSRGCRPSRRPPVPSSWSLGDRPTAGRQDTPRVLRMRRTTPPLTTVQRDDQAVPVGKGQRGTSVAHGAGQRLPREHVEPS